MGTNGTVKQNEYDVIVVGAGIAGLTCANFLVRGGKRVLVLEHNHQSGGLMSGFWRKGYYFDGGNQGFESMGISFPILDELGLYKPDEWERTKYRLKTPKLDVTINSFEDVIQGLIKAHPADENGIRTYFSEVRELTDMWAQACEEGVLPFARSSLKYNLNATKVALQRFGTNRTGLKFMEWMNKHHKTLVDQHLKDRDLNAMFSRFGYQGWSAMAASMFWYMWIYDYWYPKAGIQAFNDKLVESSKSFGCEYRFNRTVEQILVLDGDVCGVRTHKGEVFTSGQVVFCGDFRKLYSSLLPARYTDPDYVKKMQSAALSDPLISAYIGVDMSTEEMSRYLNSHHTFYFPTYDVVDLADGDNPRMHTHNWMEMTWTSMSNPGLAPAGKTAMVLQVPSSYRWNDYWKTHGREMESPSEYKELKKTVLQDLLKTADEVVPGMSKSVEYSDLGAPQSIVHYTLNAEGATCSWSWDPEKTFHVGPKMRSPVRGLYTAGQWAMWPGGVPLAMLSGKIVGEGIVNGYYSNTTDRIYQTLTGAVGRAKKLYERVTG